MPESSVATDKVRPRITVVYASATGTAQDLAYRVSRVAQRHHFPVDVISVEEIRDLNQLRSAATHGPLVFLVATAGNGAFPPTAFDLWQSLLSGQLNLDNELRGLQYAIYGLGDSTYPRFCWPERMMRKRLMDLGAVELARDEGDEQHYLGLDGTFQPFVQGLFDALNRSYPFPDHLHVLPNEVALPPSVELRLIKDCEARQVKANACSARSFEDSLTPTTQQTDHKGTRWLRLVKNQRLTSPDHFQDVRLIELETPTSSEAPLQFQAGDIAALRPVNDISDCESLLTRMGWSNSRTEHIQLWDNLRDRPVQLPPLARPQTLRREMVKDYRPTLIEYIQYHANPFAPLRPSFFPLIRPFATSELEREKLDEFCTPGDGYDDAMEYAVRQRRTVKEALDEFKSVQLPIERAAECLGGQMREREFSIASSPTVSSTSQAFRKPNTLTHEITPPFSLLPERFNLLSQSFATRPASENLGAVWQLIGYLHLIRQTQLCHSLQSPCVLLLSSHCHRAERHQSLLLVLAQGWPHSAD